MNKIWDPELCSCMGVCKNAHELVSNIYRNIYIWNDMWNIQNREKRVNWGKWKEFWDKT